MKLPIKKLCLVLSIALSALTTSSCTSGPGMQASRSQIASDSRHALDELYAKNSTARKLGRSATGVLVFPKIVKGGLVVGAEGGNGALFTHGEVSAYYQTAGASYGLQAGVQEFGYALFLMNNSEVRNLNEAKGWEVGASPSLVIVDQGMATSLTTKTIQKGTYAFFFNQKGLMAGLGLKGSKITRIEPGP